MQESLLMLKCANSVQVECWVDAGVPGLSWVRKRERERI